MDGIIYWNCIKAFQLKKFKCIILDISQFKGTLVCVYKVVCKIGKSYRDINSDLEVCRNTIHKFGAFHSKKYAN